MEAATYYQELAIASAIKEGGDDVRLALENLKEGCWSLPAIQGVFTALGKSIQAGYVKAGGSGTQFTAAQAANAAAGKELPRIMLSKEAATNFAKTKLAPTIVKGTNVYTWNVVDLYGMHTDRLVAWNSFLDNKLDAPGLTKALQAVTDGVRNDSSVTKVEVN